MLQSDWLRADEQGLDLGVISQRICKQYVFWRHHRIHKKRIYLFGKLSVKNFHKWPIVSRVSFHSFIYILKWMFSYPCADWWPQIDEYCIYAIQTGLGILSKLPYILIWVHCDFNWRGRKAIMPPLRWLENDSLIRLQTNKLHRVYPPFN